jgi:hypothetical protein
MIERIVASGKAGVAAVALDVAIKLGIDHHGWCRDEDPVPDKYRLESLPGASLGELVERAVASAQGSLYFTGSETVSFQLETTRNVAFRLNKPLLVINLCRETGFSASQRIAVWIGENRIRVLHVDGEGDSTPTRVPDLLEATFFLTMMETAIPLSPGAVMDPASMDPQATVVQTVEAAVDHLEGTLPLKHRATIANMAAAELVSLHATLGEYINRNFDLFTAGSGLLADCRSRSGRWDLPPTDAAAVIIRSLWNRLRATCRIRIVK